MTALQHCIPATLPPRRHPRRGTPPPPRRLSRRGHPWPRHRIWRGFPSLTDRGRKAPVCLFLGSELWAMTYEPW